MKKNFDVRLSTELGAPAKWALMIFTLIFVSAASARQPSDGSAAGLGRSVVSQRQTDTNSRRAWWAKHNDHQ